MTGLVYNVQSSGGVSVAALRSAVNVTTQDTAQKQIQQKAAVQESLAPDQKPISPRVRSDAGSGAVVIEYANVNGEVRQVPSKVVLAYLRAGLTANGEKAETPNADNVSTDGKKDTVSFS